MKKQIKNLIENLQYCVEIEKKSGVDECYLPEGSSRKSGRNSSRLKVSLDELKREIANCDKCDLGKARTNLVFGSGNPKASLLFVGEAPGRDEDLQGLPFVGRAGQLLTKIIEAMGMKREDVYIANILKCRPPNNRAPLPTEILACEENVKRQIEAINPKVICTLGKFASQTLLKTETTISALRGKFYEYNGIKVMPTFHPAYLLRNPDDKSKVWEDMKKVMKELGS